MPNWSEPEVEQEQVKIKPEELIQEADQYRKDKNFFRAERLYVSAIKEAQGTPMQAEINKSARVGLINVYKSWATFCISNNQFADAEQALKKEFAINKGGKSESAKRLKSLYETWGDALISELNNAGATLVYIKAFKLEKQINPSGYKYSGIKEKLKNALYKCGTSFFKKTADKLYLIGRNDKTEATKAFILGIYGVVSSIALLDGFLTMIIKDFPSMYRMFGSIIPQNSILTLIGYGLNLFLLMGCFLSPVYLPIFFKNDMECIKVRHGRFTYVLVLFSAPLVTLIGQEIGFAIVMVVARFFFIYKSIRMLSLLRKKNRVMDDLDILEKKMNKYDTRVTGRTKKQVLREASDEAYKAEMSRLSKKYSSGKQNSNATKKPVTIQNASKNNVKTSTGNTKKKESILNNPGVARAAGIGTHMLIKELFKHL